MAFLIRPNLAPQFIFIIGLLCYVAVCIHLAQSDFVLSRSVRLWQHVTRAINNKDQTEATNEKFILEEAQRKSARERKAKCEEWIPALFEQDPVTGEWHYRYAE